MSNIVFLTLDGGGNVAPAVTIAHELARRGHRVRFLAAPRQVPELSAQGFETLPYRHAQRWSPAETTSALEGIRIFSTLLGDRGYTEDLADALRTEPADIVVIDAMIVAGLQAAVGLGVPVVALMHSFASFFLRNPAMKAVAWPHRVDPDRAWASATRTLVTADRELDPGSRRRAPANFVWTGPAEPVPAGPAVPSPGQPTVLLSLSTVAAPGQQRVMQNALDAVASMPVSVIATTGPVIDPARLRAGENTRLVRSLPHAEILPVCSAVIGHGGHSTTMRALMHGLPLVVIPCDTRIDQPMIGKAVERAGAGIRLPKKASPERIRGALRTVLEEPRYREAAGRIGERMRSAPGAVRGAAEVLAVANRGAAV